MIYRNKKLLDAAKDSPQCFGCGLPNDGTVVAAHSNQQRDGKGMGHKAHDCRVAYLCRECHDILDKSPLPRHAKQEIFEEAWRRTVLHWFETGVVK